MNKTNLTYGLLVVFLASCVAPTTRKMSVDSSLTAREAQIQKEIFLKNYFNNQRRIERLNYQLSKGSLPFCQEHKRKTIGVNLTSKESWDKTWANAISSTLKYGDGVVIYTVQKGSPADRAGLKDGDVIMTINNRPINKGRGDVQKVANWIGGSLKTQSYVEMLIHRNQGEKLFKVSGEETCYFPISLQNDESINAFADGERIVLTQGMMRFAGEDNELALVISHEMAHNVMNHLRSKKMNAIPGLLLDLLAAAYGVNTRGALTKAAANAYSQDFETEADYVGLYIMARAGFDIEKAPDFWRRMATINPGGIQGNRAVSHPSGPERFLRLEKAVVEIKEKAAKGLPLVPELQEEIQEEELENESSVEENSISDGVYN